ncbi:MAG: acyltransferase [Gemmatimonadota bacterium]|nr:acyltransferase [Gemmatimonadota bacterium]
MILLVVLFHAGVSWAAGGFIGVDVFFVISGFFITGVLLREHENDGRIDIARFYGQRALRLAPAFLVVLLATLAAVMGLYAPIDRAPIFASARSIAFYSGNAEFVRNTVDYFSAGENPLLHTWSLAVEEQFYLVWPLLIIVVLWLVRARTRDDYVGGVRAERKWLISGIALAALVSLATAIALTENSQPVAFFSLSTRIWEFALGALVAILLGDDETLGAAAGTGLQFAGLVAIGCGVVAYDRATPYPGIAALAPALGAVALLVGGARAPEGIVTRALSARWLQWLGRMSYAWYLWHWPLVGVGGTLDPRLGVAGKLAWSAAALVLAWVTYHAIERPARDGRLRIPTHWLPLASLGASAVVALVAQGALRVAERDVARPDQRAFAAAREDHMTHDCWATTVDEPKGACEFGDINSSTTIALLGDSHAEHWLGGLDRAGRANGWKIVAMVKGGCPVADMPTYMHLRLKRYYTECTRYREAMVQRIIAQRPSAIILSSWDHYIPADGVDADWQVTPEMWRTGLRRTYERLVATGIPVVVIRGTPRTWFDVPACLSRRAASLPMAGECTYERSRSLSPVALRAQNDAARGLPIRFVDMNDAICSTPRCSVVRNGVVVFTDDNHLTASFSKSVARLLGQRVAQAMAAR